LCASSKLKKLPASNTRLSLSLTRLAIMGVFAFSDEFTSPVPPARLFKALILDFGNLLPKLLPQLIKSVEFTQGNGEAGSIRQISFQDGECKF